MRRGDLEDKGNLEGHLDDHTEDRCTTRYHVSGCSLLTKTHSSKEGGRRGALEDRRSFNHLDDHTEDRRTTADDGHTKKRSTEPSVRVGCCISVLVDQDDDR